MDSPRVALSLTTEVSRETVEIDEQPHELAVPGDLTLQQFIDFRRGWIRMQELEALEKVTKAQTAEYELLNLQLAQMVLPSAVEELASMRDTGQHQAVVLFFFRAAIQRDPRRWSPLLMLAQLNGASISARSSRDSSTTTPEETPKSG